MADDEGNSESESPFDEETLDLFDQLGIAYHENPGPVFKKRKGMHVAEDDGIVVVNVAGNASMKRNWDESGADAVERIFDLALQSL